MSVRSHVASGLVACLLLGCSSDVKQFASQPIKDGGLPGNGGAESAGGAATADSGGAPSTGGVAESAGTTGSGGTGVGAGGVGAGGELTPGDASTPPGDSGADAGHCGSDGDCGAPNRFCVAGACVECLSDQHCTGGKTCGKTDHVCKFACASSADCKDPQPYCDTRRGECVQCLGDANCSAGYKNVCDSKTRTCVECAAAADCSCLLPGQVPCCTQNNYCTCGLLFCL